MPADAPPRRIWVTRALPQAEATAARLRALGFTPVVAPVLEIRPVADATADLAGVDTLAFTSAAGVSAFAAVCDARGLAVFAVGNATADTARAVGFTDVRSAQGDVHALAALIADAAPALVLNPTAADPAADLPALLAARGVAARAIVVYETVEAALENAPPDFAGVLIHSAKAARAVARLMVNSEASAVTAFAISPAAAAPLASLQLRHIAISPSPNEAALLDLLGSAA